MTYQAGGTAEAPCAQGKQFFVKSFDLSFKNTTIVVLTYMFVQNKRNTLRLLRSAPAADFPRDVCLTISCNHKVFLLYSVGDNIIEWAKQFGMKQ